MYVDLRGMVFFSGKGLLCVFCFVVWCGDVFVGRGIFIGVWGGGCFY